MSSDLNTENPLENISSQILQRAVESSRSPLIITDNLLPDNPIIYSNRAFTELTGYEMDEIIGKNCRFLQGDDSSKSEIDNLRNAVKLGEDVRVTLKNYRKDGTVFWNDLVVSPVKDNTGQTTHFIGMQLDITNQIANEDKLIGQADQLQRSNHELEQFTYATSHDLQEPLRMISSYVQLLSQRYGDTMDEDGRTFLNFAAEGAERMQRLIDDLLTLSRVPASRSNFRMTDADELVNRARFNLKLAIDESGAQIKVSKMPEILADPTQITLLFQNILSNAIKYRSKSMACMITISAVRKGSNTHFKVTDNGIGIAAKDLDRVFVIFQRLHTRSEYPGTGVGLTICQKIIERHGGRIWIESKENVGSEFNFTLPVGKGN